MNLLKKILSAFLREEVEAEEKTTTDFEDSSVSSSGTGRPKPQYILIRPQNREDLLPIADHLLGRKSVIVNLEAISSETKRFIDFLSGVAYALNGQVKKVDTNTFLVLPGGLEITGDIFDNVDLSQL